MSEERDPDLPEPIHQEDRGWIYVDSSDALDDCVAVLTECDVIGVDTESDSFFSHKESCCLMQVSGPATADYVIDPLAFDDLAALGPLFADSGRVKIFHGADYDVVSMKRDFGFVFPNLFDTMIAAQATGHTKFGLNDLVGRYFGVKLNKKWQRHDWSSRPLRKEHLEYARNDSRFLPALRRILMVQAEERSRIAMLEEEFTLLEGREWTGRPFEPNDCMKIKGSGALDDDAKKVLRSLFVLRESIAEARNRPPFKVWGNDMMMAAARANPKDMDGLRAALGEKHHVVRRYSREVMDAIRAGQDDNGAVPVLVKKVARSNPGVPPFTRDDEPLMASLKKWRNAHSQEIALAPSMVVNNTILKEVSALKPKEVAALDAISEMRVWQKQAYGQMLVDRVAQWTQSHPDDGQPSRRRRRRRRRGKKPVGEAADDGDAPNKPAAPDAG
ncbi:MAG: hypothetical protein GY898_28805 [Proteobacteria bacterium]|nr:hypothetical protein [Pseudomonadota bacterium]